MINGQGPFVFVIDTGSARTAISDRVATALRLPPGPMMLVHGVTAAEVTPSVRINALGFASRRFRDLQCPVFSRVVLGADGLLGLDVLSRYRLTLDIGRRMLQVIPSSDRGIGIESVPSSRVIRAGNRIRRERFGQLVLMDVAAEGIPVEAFIDTGSQYSIGNPALFRALGARRPSLYEQRQAARIYGVTGQVLEGDVAAISTLEIAGRRLSSTAVLFAPLHAFDILGLAERPAMLIGADIISRFRSVTINFATSNMSFGPVTRPNGFVETGSRLETR